MASGPSCVGQFASTNAQHNGAAFGADISFGARFASQPNLARVSSLPSHMRPVRRVSRGDEQSVGGQWPPAQAAGATSSPSERGQEEVVGQRSL